MEPESPPRRPFPAPSGAAGAAHFAGPASLARSARSQTLRAAARIAAAPAGVAACPLSSPTAASPSDATAAPLLHAAAASPRLDAPCPAPPACAAPPVRSQLGTAPAAPSRAAPSRAAPSRAAHGRAAHGRAADWPRPPSCLTAAQLSLPPERARVAVCGLVIVRQRPGSAKGVTFVTLEDETGVVNVVIWAKVYEAHRRVVLAARLMRATGRIQRDGPVTHVVADLLEDLSPLLDGLARGPRIGAEALARADEVRRPQPDGARGPGPAADPDGAAPARGLIRNAAPRVLHPRDQARLTFRDRPDP